MTEDFERQSRNSVLDRRSYLKAASSIAGVATLGSVASAAESEEDGDDASEPSQGDQFHETFDDLSAFSGDVSAFEIVTSEGN